MYKLLNTEKVIHVLITSGFNYKQSLALIKTHRTSVFSHNTISHTYIFYDYFFPTRHCMAEASKPQSFYNQLFDQGLLAILSTLPGNTAFIC